MVFSSPRSTSQRPTAASSPPEASVRPSGEKARQRTQSVCSPRTICSRPQSASPNQMVRSWLPVARTCPFGEKATALTGQECLCNRRPLLGPCTQCSTTSPLPFPTARDNPSGAKANDQTALQLGNHLPCPRRKSRPLRLKRQKRRSPAQSPETNILPSGANATTRTSSRKPVSVWGSCPKFKYHSLTVLSALPEASIRPSGEYAKQRTGPVWPRRINMAENLIQSCVVSARIFLYVSRAYS